MKKRIIAIAFLAICCFVFSFSAFAHSGRIDSYGGHNSHNGYHYHHGYPAHEHTNGVCPYDYNNKISAFDNASSVSNNVSTKSNFLQSLWIDEYPINEIKNTDTTHKVILFFILCVSIAITLGYFVSIIQQCFSGIDLKFLKKHYGKRTLSISFIKSTLSFLISFMAIVLLWYFKPIPLLPAVVVHFYSILFFDQAMFGRKLYLFLLAVTSVLLCIYTQFIMVLYMDYFDAFDIVLQYGTLVFICGSASINLKDLTDDFWSKKLKIQK